MPALFADLRPAANFVAIRQPVNGVFRLAMSPAGTCRRCPNVGFRTIVAMRRASGDANDPQLPWVVRQGDVIFDPWKRLTARPFCVTIDESVDPHDQIVDPIPIQAISLSFCAMKHDRLTVPYRRWELHRFQKGEQDLVRPALCCSGQLPANELRC
jgi:hypothetical protein